jgi:iron-sulfur cluster assembly protein
MSDVNAKAPETPTSEDTIIMTPAAVTEVKRLISEEEDNEGLMLRVGVQGGGCGGLSYVMAFDKDKNEYDRTLDFDGLTVVVDTKSLLYMAGTVIDFSKEILSGGFKFANPKSSRSCGCGTSFSV